MTARALELIAAVDVVLYDALIPATALDGARPDAELVDVGKRGGGAQVPQETTEQLLVRHALAGRSVARVKGGDPFVFGRGGEEAARLRAQGIPFEVVPGVTAGIAGPAYAGIPVTHREHAPGVAFVTGHENPDKPESTIDWPGLAGFPGTLVFYMGVRRLPQITASLIGGGRSADEPAAVVQSGTVGGQRVVTGTVGTIAEVASEAGIAAPAVTVVGSVASLRDELRWFEDRPLFGRTVAVTRARAQASGLARRLRALGAEVIETPTIRTRSLAATVPPLGAFDVIALTSPNGVRELVASLLRDDRDVRELHAATIAAVGPGTARVLREVGLRADVVPETFTGEALAAALTAGDGRAGATGAPDGGGRGASAPRRVLLARAATGGSALPDVLRAAGDEVTELALYETVAEPLSDAAREQIAAADYVTFTSASTATFLAQAGGMPTGDRPRPVSIGPVTTAALSELRVTPAVEAAEATIDGLVAALVADASD
ncbi:MAG: uroporphyrinogen-III C-methyltransferase [Patulibacter sp.]|nr:uroporphyrinogen-III C-methyltransferase [Patulibacter sp.]